MLLTKKDLKNINSICCPIRSSIRASILTYIDDSIIVSIGSYIWTSNSNCISLSVKSSIHRGLGDVTN